jgi:YggT family protein
MVGRPALCQAARLASASGARVGSNPAGFVFSRAGLFMFAILNLIANLIYMVATLYIWVLIVSAILSWLVMFNVLNTQNRVVYMVGDFLYRITEPALRPIRRFVPLIGGIDISPVVLIIALYVGRQFIIDLLRDIASWV